MERAKSSRFKSVALMNVNRRDSTEMRNRRKNKLFRRIEADIKERDRKRVPGPFEEYIDQSRGISVNLGPADIRTSMLKQRMFLSKTYVFMQEEQQGFKVFVEQAAHEMHRGAFDRALGYLNRAVRLNGDDPMALIERAHCYNELQRFEDALKDADKALLRQRRPTAKGLYMKADALYNLGQFEHALMFYYRALKRSSSNGEEDLIRDRIGRAIKAVDNAIGAQASGHFLAMPAVLSQIPSTIFGMPWHELKAMNKQVSEDKSNRQKRHRRNLLGRLSHDLDYLEGLLTEVKLDLPPEEENPLTTSGGGEIIKKPDAVTKKTEEAITFLKERQEFWSQFKPIYSK